MSHSIKERDLPAEVRVFPHDMTDGSTRRLSTQQRFELMLFLSGNNVVPGVHAGQSWNRRADEFVKMTKVRSNSSITE